MDKATRKVNARPCEVDRGDGRGESGAREGGEDGWLSSLSAAAPEVRPDVKSGSADWGVPGGSKEDSAKRNMGEKEGSGVGRTGTRRRTRRRAVRTGTRRRIGRVAWTWRTRRPETHLRRWLIDFRPLSQEDNGSR